MNKTIAIIPARGGSKRIPKKNIVPFCGKPLIAWTIEAARESAIFDRILVSTDDEEVAAIARQWGAEAPFLRAEAHDDHAPVTMATLHAISQAQNHFTEEYDVVVQLMPNCPLRKGVHIKDACERFFERDGAFQLSCFKFGWMNPWWAMSLDEKGHPAPLFPEALKKRSQDLEKLYCPSGAIWIAKVSALRESCTFYGPAHIFHPIDWKAAVDIDDLEDLEMAKALYQMDEGHTTILPPS